MLLKQHFVNAFRMMRRRKLASAVNIIGLAVGLASVLLLISYVRVERSFDRYHKKSDRLYILTNEFREEFYGGSHHFLAGMLASRFPEVRSTARFDVLRLPLKTGGDPFFQQVAMVDPGLFSLLDFPVRSGDPTRDLVPPRQAFLSSEAAGRLFSEGDPRGKTLSIRLADGFRDYVVAGVFRDFPGNSSLRFDVAVNFENFFPAIGLDRNSTDFVYLPLNAVTFLEIPTPDEARLLLSKLPAFHLESEGTVAGPPLTGKGKPRLCGRRRWGGLGLLLYAPDAHEPHAQRHHGKYRQAVHGASLEPGLLAPPDHCESGA